MDAYVPDLLFRDPVPRSLCADVGASRRGSDAGALVLALSYRDHLELSGVALTDSDLFALRYFAHCL